MIETEFPSQRDESGMSSDWREGVGCSILTPSYYDSNGDGIGDIEGVRKKLDYLSNLGIDAIHLTPFFKTQLYDIGYDVDDYQEIDPRYGDIESFKRLIQSAHELGIRVVTDLVINHTSVHHPWFQDSRKSRDNAKRDWYIWQDPKADGSPPNNWVGNFGGSAWEYDKETGQYYLHTFLPEQADLNWTNPEARQAMHAVMRFWADMGVDGFRLDSLPYIAKADGLPDATPNPDYVEGVDHPSKRVHNDEWWFREDMLVYLKEFSDIIEQEYPGKFLFSESNPPEYLKEWRQRLYRAAPGNVHAIINSTLVNMPWNADAIANHLNEFYDMLRPEDIAMLQMSNHDVTIRLVQKLAKEHPENAEAQARNAAMLLLTLPGMPWIYYGDEIGMRGETVPYDPENPFLTHTFRRFGYDRTKDAARMPMAWDNTHYGGFSSVPPCIPASSEIVSTNVQAQMTDRQSMLHLYRRLIKYRQASQALREGSFRQVDSNNHQVLTYELSHEDKKEVVVLNMTNDEQLVDLDYRQAQIILDTDLTNDYGMRVDLRRLPLRRNQGVIFSVSE